MSKVWEISSDGFRNKADDKKYIKVFNIFGPRFFTYQL